MRPGEASHPGYREEWHPGISLSLSFFSFLLFFSCHPYSSTKQRHIENAKTICNGIRKASNLVLPRGTWIGFQEAELRCCSLRNGWGCTPPRRFDPDSYGNWLGDQTA